MQDIYSIAISRILNKKIPLLGTLIGKYYYYLEKQCENKSDKIVVISPDFKKFIDTKNLNKTSIVENWSPIIKPNKKGAKHIIKHNIAEIPFALIGCIIFCPLLF